ncbi:JAB domain-containing protein [Elizabethkingia anophelis]|nr:JAB domain-containing protein [Elizabethkingia anophelis]MCT4062915.1 JAB domain-containing protein [Elizabethkingia anophelis]MCT4109206.1 JAB domain-containing protein [Elizabethkingia anophelis]
MNQAEQYIYGQNTNFGFPKSQETRYIKTSKGKELPYELFTNASSNSGSSIIREETHSGYSTDFALVQRQYTENKQLSFIAGTKIQNINDVAWLFRSLEDEAIEHAFILYRFKDNSYMVQQLSSGGITGTVVDLRLVAGNAFALNPSSITLVHNHPSGNLVSSNEDRNILRMLQNIFEGSNIQVEDGIVINLRSGKYLVFNENEDGDRIKELKNQYEKQSNVAIYSFSKQIFATNYQPQKITGPEDVAAFISTQKFGISDKTEALILNNANEIVGKFILPQHKQFEKLVELMTVHAGAGTILYGNNISKEMFNDYNKRLSPTGFKILDAILLQSNNYYSLAQNEIIKDPQYTEFKINNANEDPHIDFRVGEEDSSLKYANNNYQNTKNMNISSLNWVEKLLLHNTKAYKDFVKNISNHKEIKASSEQEKKFLEIYYNRELKKDNPNNFLFSARTLNEKKQTTQINNFLNGSETELFLKNIDFNNKAYLFKDIKHQNEIIISNPVLVNGILKELDDYKKEHGINHTESAKNMIFTVATQKEQTHNLESHPYSIAEGNWIKNQEKYTNLTPKYAVSILLQNNGEKKLHFIDNRNQNVVVIDNAAITQKVISDLYAKELENRTDLSKGLTNTQIDEKQALHYRNYETEARKLGIAITPHTEPTLNSDSTISNNNHELSEKFREISDLYLDQIQNAKNMDPFAIDRASDLYNTLSENQKIEYIDSLETLLYYDLNDNQVSQEELENFLEKAKSDLEYGAPKLEKMSSQDLEEIMMYKLAKYNDLIWKKGTYRESHRIDMDMYSIQKALDLKDKLGQYDYSNMSTMKLDSLIITRSTKYSDEQRADNYSTMKNISIEIEKIKEAKSIKENQSGKITGSVTQSKNSDFIFKDLNITAEQAKNWKENKQNTLTKEQLEQIPDAILNFELSSNQKIKLALGEKIAFADNYDDWDYIFQKTKDNKISATYRGTGEEFLLSNRAIKLINQKIIAVQNNDFDLEGAKLTEWQKDNTSDLIDGFENTPEELKEVMEKWQQKIDDGLDYNDCANFQKECEALGYTFDYGLDSVPFDLRKIDLKEHNINNQNSKIMTTQNKDFDQVKYLKDQLKYLQFGEGEKLHKDLEAGINSSEKEFQIKTSSNKTLPGNTVDFTLNYNKSEKGGIFLNSYQAELKNKKGEELSHIFNISKENTFDAKEAINLLEGRSVKIEFMNPKIEEKQTAFVKLDFNEPKTEYGTYKFQSFHENYGVNTAEIVDKSGLIFDKPEWKDDTIKSLERGNIVNVKFKHEDKEIEGKAFLNPQYKTLNLYDSNMTRINTNKPLEGMGNDNAHDKNNVREQNRSRGI